MAPELLGCPFCGGDADPEYWYGYGGLPDVPPRHGPGCNDCGAEAASVEAWNRRAALTIAPESGLSDEQIIEIRKATRCRDFSKQYGDSIAFARAIQARAALAAAPESGLSDADRAELPHTLREALRAGQNGISMVRSTYLVRICRAALSTAPSLSPSDSSVHPAGTGGSVERSTFQGRVQPWLEACFGAAIAQVQRSEDELRGIVNLLGWGLQADRIDVLKGALAGLAFDDLRALADKPNRDLPEHPENYCGPCFCNECVSNAQ